MTTGADAFVVVGHTACRLCGDWFITGTRSGKLCESCATEQSATSRTAEVIASIEGRTVVHRPTRARKRKREKLDADKRQRKREWNRARSIATQRLVRIHHDLYLSLLAESKAELGIDPRLDHRSVSALPLEREMSA